MAKTKTPNVFCGTCNLHFYKKPSEILKSKSGKVYCSKACAAIPCRREKPCLICGAMILGGACKKTCSPECARKNLSNPDRNHSKGKSRGISKAVSGRSFKKRLILERGNKCEACGYGRSEILNVHHIIEKCKGGTDHVANLLVVCPNCHTEIHKKIRNPNGAMLERQ